VHGTRVATKNKKKLQEIKDILRDLDLRITSLKDYRRAPRIIENGKTFKDNAIKKAVKIAHFTGKLTWAKIRGCAWTRSTENPAYILQGSREKARATCKII